MLKLVYMEPEGPDFSTVEAGDSRQALQAIKALEAVRELTKWVIVIPVGTVELDSESL
ncbi:hypothetical protein [Aeromonas media]|uniref:hypothetical protein n=1 Tax=Aeromonas media TaxID=651 RepID=UPI00148AFA7F|nr:hypothetical protein [Aeromonas media]